MSCTKLYIALGAKKENIIITVNLGFPPSKQTTHHVYTCDLSRDYITINADYHT